MLQQTGMAMAMNLSPLLSGAVGIALVVTILWDAFETILVPRRIGRRVRLTRYFYAATWRAWRAVAERIRKPSRREAMLGFYGPLSLILLLALWATGLLVAFALMQIAALRLEGMPPARFGMLLYMSGETFFTLGFGDITPAATLGRFLAVLEAGMGFAFLATVIGYLPTMYTAFAQREVEISRLDARAGSPPTAAEFLGRLSTAGDGAAGDELLRDCERWSAQLLETHISYPQLAYYRSQHSNQSWLGALTAMLDASALMIATAETPSPHQAQLTFAMARHALVDITQIFVSRPRRPVSDRLPPEDLGRLRAHLAASPRPLRLSAESEARLSALRLQYEPYAQALAAYLLFELPPWIHAGPRRDNWRGGPWDKALAAEPHPAHREDEHF